MKIILDLDCGVDDAHALILALSEPEAEVLAVTCVEGNTKLDNVCRNTLRILKLCNRLDVPVYRGCDKCLMGRQSLGTDFHGVDGMGDCETDDVDMSLIQKEHAVTALLRIVNQHPGEITLFATAPLTNVALALRLDPDFGRKLESATIMGGNIQGIGNIKIGGEFNFTSDPEAAYIVLNELNCPITLLALEPTVEHALPMDWFHEWVSIDTERGSFNKRITQKVMENMKEETLDDSKFVLYDAVAMVTLLYPESIIETDRQYCSVEVQGELSRGMMLVDWHGHLGRKPNVNILKKINTDIVMSVMTRSMSISTENGVNGRVNGVNGLDHDKYNNGTRR